MPRVVVLNGCSNCRECVEVCPMSCFHEAPEMVAVNINECIDCGLCESVCPAEVIINGDNGTDERYLIFAEKNQVIASSNPKAFK